MYIKEKVQGLCKHNEKDSKKDKILSRKCGTVQIMRNSFGMVQIGSKSDSILSRMRWANLKTFLQRRGKEKRLLTDF
jgi:hypothetical protein